MPADPWYDYLRGLGQAVRQLFGRERRDAGIARTTSLRNPQNALGADYLNSSEMAHAEQFTIGYDPLTGLTVLPFTSDFSSVPYDGGTAQGGTASTITLRAGASAVDDYAVGEYVTIISGTGAGQQGVMTDYVGATKVATVEPDWTVNPDNTSSYIVGDPTVVIA